MGRGRFWVGPSESPRAPGPSTFSSPTSGLQPRQWRYTCLPLSTWGGIGLIKGKRGRRELAFGPSLRPERRTGQPHGAQRPVYSVPSCPCSQTRWGPGEGRQCWPWQALEPRQAETCPSGAASQGCSHPCLPPAGVAQPSFGDLAWAGAGLLSGPLHLRGGPGAPWVSWRWLTCQPTGALLGFSQSFLRQEGSLPLL